MQKFNYLRVQLQREAARAVAGFPLTDVNYCHSVEILKERFGQTDKVKDAHMQAFLDLPQPRNTIADLRTFMSYIRGLLCLGITQDSYSVY